MATKVYDCIYVHNVKNVTKAKAFFRLAFPERPEEKLDQLIVEMQNKDGEIGIMGRFIMFLIT